jgi:hypothetical protein
LLDAALDVFIEHGPGAALVQYMHCAIDMRTAAVFPASAGEVPLDDEEILRAREAGRAAVQPLVDAAHQAACSART